MIALKAIIFILHTFGVQVNPEPSYSLIRGPSTSATWIESSPRSGIFAIMGLGLQGVGYLGFIEVYSGYVGHMGLIEVYRGLRK